jgi:hypothetical protein
MRNLFLSTLLWAALTLQLACIQTAPPLNVFHLGDKVQTGSLTYTVLETKWRAQIGEGPLARVPEHRFLVIHLTVTNTSPQSLDLSPFTIVDQSGQTYPESMDGRSIPYWMGMIRQLKPSYTLDGTVVFDVEPKSYKLKLDDVSGAAMAMVELPLQFEAGEPAIPSPVQ